MLRTEAVGPSGAAPTPVRPPPTDVDTWLALSPEPLPSAEASSWAVRPDCGAVVTFTGTARDHAEGRAGVVRLEYEAYTEHVLPQLATIVHEGRRRWPAIGRVALLHRVGPLAVTEAAVVVVVSAPHRAEAFEAARFAIDEVKASVPIWKREHWAGGSAWGHVDGDRQPHDDRPVAPRQPVDPGRGALP